MMRKTGTKAQVHERVWEGIGWVVERFSKAKVGEGGRKEVCLLVEGFSKGEGSEMRGEIVDWFVEVVTYR